MLSSECLLPRSRCYVRVPFFRPSTATDTYTILHRSAYTSISCPPSESKFWPLGWKFVSMWNADVGRTPKSRPGSDGDNLYIRVVPHEIGFKLNLYLGTENTVYEFEMHCTLRWMSYRNGFGLLTKSQIEIGILSWESKFLLAITIWNKKKYKTIFINLGIEKFVLSWFQKKKLFVYFI